MKSVTDLTLIMLKYHLERNSEEYIKGDRGGQVMDFCF